MFISNMPQIYVHVFILLIDYVVTNDLFKTTNWIFFFESVQTSSFHVEFESSESGSFV